MTLSTSENLTNLVKATVDFHRVFCSDRVRSHYSPGFVDQLEVFVGEARMIRWGLLATKEKVAEIWDNVIPTAPDDNSGVTRVSTAVVNENFVDYVLNGSAYVRLMVDIPSAHWESFLNDLSRHLAWPHRTSLIDGELKDRSAEPSFIKACFEDADWLLFIYLLSISPLEFSPDPLVFDDTLSKGDND